MLLEANVIEGLYVGDLLEQPEALRRTLTGLDSTPTLRRLVDGEYRRIVLTGMGSSLFALYPLYLQLIANGRPALLIETAELIHYLEPTLDEHTLVIAVSQSGASAEIVRLLDLVHNRCKVVGVCNSPASPLATDADAVVPLQAGPESAVSCKTYVSTLLALRWLGALMTAEPLAEVCNSLSEAPTAVRQYLKNWRGHVADIAAVLEPIRQIFITGRGPSLATAQTGGLILKESTRSAGEGMSSAAFRHGPFELLSRQTLVVIMEGDGKSEMLNRKLADDVRQTGAVAKIVGPHGTSSWEVPDIPSDIRQIMEILPVQMLTLAVASCKGVEAGKFALATKITDVE